MADILLRIASSLSADIDDAGRGRFLDTDDGVLNLEVLGDGTVGGGDELHQNTVVPESTVELLCNLMVNICRCILHTFAYCCLKSPSNSPMVLKGI